MIKYYTKEVYIKIDGQGSDYSLDACLDAVTRLIKETRVSAETPRFQDINKEIEKGVREIQEHSEARLKNNTTMDRSMRERIPNILDVTKMDLINPERAEGFRCPACNQSAFLHINPGTSNKETIMRRPDGLYTLQEVEIDFGTVAEYDKEMSLTENIDRLASYLSDEKVYLVHDSEVPCECPRCGDILVMDEFVKEFSETNSEFEHPCLICGGEVIMKDLLQEDGTTERTMVCEECRSEIQY